MLAWASTGIAEKPSSMCLKQFRVTASKLIIADVEPLPALHIRAMSDLKAKVRETEAGFHVEGYERIEYDFAFVGGIFDIANPNLAKCYNKWGRVLAVTDKNVYALYGRKMKEYFQHFNLDLKVHQTSIGEKSKTILSRMKRSIPR
ncbi:hypothetical protein ANO14919_024900 [Xylariales sp. No.14919]|nr:hypothetical protein ANO14919_024900 [Xylariales sp. No.14919]